MVRMRGATVLLLALAVLLVGLWVAVDPVDARTGQKQTAATAPPAQATQVPSAPPTPNPSSAASPAADGSPAPGGSPRPTPMDVSSYLTATVAAINLSDAPVTVTLDVFDPSTGEQQSTGVKIDLAPLDALQQKVLAAGYVLTFTRAGSAPETCRFAMKAADAREFVILEAHILVTQPGASPASGADLDVATSSLCH
jgi:hypothetical protein